MRRLAILAAAMVAAASAPAEQFKPSFDCAKAQSAAEKAICEDEGLARLDRDLSEAYQSALKVGTADRTAQVGWIRRRDAECSSAEFKSCLRTRMQERIAEFRRGPLAGEKELAPPSSDRFLPAPTEANRLLRPIGSVDKFRPNRRTIFGNRFVFDQFDTSGNAKEIVSLDPATGGSIVVASHLHEPTVLFSDSSLTVVVEPYLEGGIEVVVFDSPTGTERNRLKIGKVPTAATVVGQELRLAWTSEQFPPRLAVDIIDLFNNRQVASHEIWNVPNNGRAVFWKDKIVLVSPGVITLYNERLDELVSAPAPDSKPYANSFCGVREPRSFGSRLIYQISCGHIVVFDLDRFAIVREIERFDPSMFLSLDVAGDLLFAVPIDAERKPSNGAVFDLTSGRRVAVLPLTADAVAVHEDFLAALAPPNRNDPSAPRPILLYHLDRDELSDDAQARTLEQAHERALDVLSRSGSFDGAIDAIESAVTDRLFEVGTLEQKLREAALDYGAWLSATFDRRADGIKLIERLVAAAPRDLTARHRLGAALLRDYLVTGSQASLERGQSLLADRPNLLPAQGTSIPTARSTPIDFGAFPNRIAFWLDKIVVGGWQGKLSTLSVYDRATLQPLWSRDIARPSAERDEEIEGFTFEGNRILAWLGPRVAIVDMSLHDVTVRPLRGTFDTVLQTPNGVLGCEGTAFGQCALIDPKTFRTTERFQCDPMQLAGRDSADQETLGRLVVPRCQVDIHGQLVALGRRWMMTSEGAWPGPYALNYRRVQKQARWEGSDLPLLKESNAKILAAADGAIIDSPRPASHRFIRLDFATGGHRTLFQLDDRHAAGIAWAIVDQTLIVGAGHDLILYHLANNHMAGVLHNVIAEEFKDNGHGVDDAKIVRLLVDGPRIIVLTSDGKYSRMLQTQDVLDYAKQTVQPFKLVEDELRR